MNSRSTPINSRDLTKGPVLITQVSDITCSRDTRSSLQGNERRSELSRGEGRQVSHGCREVGEGIGGREVLKLDIRI